ncbi:MAG: hybrid sensor histidine kinase/response regulator [Bacteroidota bacterium]
MQKSEHRGSKILIVDDNHQNLQVLGNFLKSTGYLVEFALNGKSALEWLNQRTFDLILLDIMMPDISGLEVCRRIRENEKLADLPIIFISADSEKSTILEGFGLGGQDYITKPFDPRELLARVKTHLELRQSRERLAALNRDLEKTVRERTAELNEALTELKKANEELQESEKIKNDFLNIISHEIRTPLNGIIGPLELIRLKLEDPNILRLVELLDHSVARLEKFSYTALKITELRTQKIRLAMVPVQLNQITEALARQNPALAARKNLHIDTVHTLKNLEVSGDKHLITTCVQCLLDQCFHLSDENSRVRIMTGRDKEFIYIDISGEGRGLPLTDKDKLYAIFSSVEKVTDNNPGLDLALARLVMEAHQGQLEITQDGGRFIFRMLFQGE